MESVKMNASVPEANDVKETPCNGGHHGECWEVHATFNHNWKIQPPTYPAPFPMRLITQTCMCHSPASISEQVPVNRSLSVVFEVHFMQALWNDGGVENMTN